MKEAALAASFCLMINSESQTLLSNCLNRLDKRSYRIITSLAAQSLAFNYRRAISFSSGRICLSDDRERQLLKRTYEQSGRKARVAILKPLQKCNLGLDRAHV